jgi:hypothetical protein
MIEAHTAEVWSALLGLVGALLLAIPFFADFRAKRDRWKRRDQIKLGTFSAKDEALLTVAADKVALERILKADTGMALCSALGCLLLLLSFIVLLLKAR